MNTYEAKQADRRERMAARAERLRAYAAAEFRKADLREEVSGIPMGQPILVGHHSEKRHRRALRRADDAMRRAIAAQRAAERLESALQHATTRPAISSDDPDAIEKLREKIEKAERDQEMFKAVNKLVRKKDRAGMAALGMSEKAIENAFTPDFCGRIGVPAYVLQNNNANIRRMKERIAILEQNAKRERTENIVNGVRVVENAEENRLQLFFPGKPDDAVRKALKGSGFRWSPSAGAWQRQLNNSARWAAECVLKTV